MQKAIDAIEKFIPSCEQEEADKKIFLEVTRNNPDCLIRKSSLVHFSVSAWVMNQAKTKVLCCYHDLYDGWMWLGGHADGDDDFLHVAKKEIEEESGVTNLELFGDGIISLESLPVALHVKKGKCVPSHVHLNVTYAFIADEKDATRIAHGENSDVGWKDFDELIRLTPFKHDAIIFQKIIAKVKGENNAQNRIAKRKNVKVITICGSCRFQNQIMQAAERLELAGNCVLSMVYVPHGKNKDDYSKEQFEIFDKLHKTRIDMSDAIYVVNVGGYIGSSTKNEIEYAKKCGKEILYLES